MSVMVSMAQGLAEGGGAVHNAGGGEGDFRG